MENRKRTFSFILVFLILSTTVTNAWIPKRYIEGEPSIKHAKEMGAKHGKEDIGKPYRNDVDHLSYEEYNFHKRYSHRGAEFMHNYYCALLFTCIVPGAYLYTEHTRNKEIITDRNLQVKFDKRLNAVDLLGKSPEYVKTYKKAYIKQTKKELIGPLLLGCCLGQAMQYALLTILIEE